MRQNGQAVRTSTFDAARAPIVVTAPASFLSATASAAAAQHLQDEHRSLRPAKGRADLALERGAPDNVTVVVSRYASA